MLPFAGNWVLFVLSLLQIVNTSQVTLPNSTGFIEVVSAGKSQYKELFESPKCWIGTFQEIIKWDFPQAYYNNAENDDSSAVDIPGKTVCALLTNQQRTLLALRLAKCFLVKNGRTFPTACEEIHSDPENCKQNLTDAQFQIFTEMYLNIHNTCTQLSVESWNDQIRASTQALRQESKLFAQSFLQSQEHFEESFLQSQEHFEESFLQSQEHFEDTLSDISENHRLELEKFNEDSRAKQQSYFNEMNSELKSSSTEVRGLVKIIQQVHGAVEYGLNQSTVVKSLLFFLLQLNGIFFLTTVLKTHNARPYSLSLCSLGFILELGIHRALASGLLGPSFKDVFLLSSRKYSSMASISVILLFLCLKRKDQSFEEPIKQKDLKTFQEDLKKQIEISLTESRLEVLRSNQKVVDMFQESLHLHQSVHQYRNRRPFYSSLIAHEQDSIERSIVKIDDIYTDKDKTSLYPPNFISPAQIERFESITTTGSFLSAASKNDSPCIEEVEQRETNITTKTPTDTSKKGLQKKLKRSIDDTNNSCNTFSSAKKPKQSKMVLRSRAVRKDSPVIASHF